MGVNWFTSGISLLLLFLLANAEKDKKNSQICTERLTRFVVINMPQRLQRLQQIKQNIDMLNLNSVVDVVTPLSRDRIKTLDDVRIYPQWKMSESSVHDALKGDDKALKQTSAFWTQDITLGEVSLTLAHLEAAGRALNDTAALTIVLEDDSVFIEEFVRVLEAMLLELPDDFDFIFLGDEAIGWKQRRKISRFLSLREYAYQVKFSIICAFSDSAA
jgi:GR25 family glycosyltransferase involved in LPS biosynthesis